MDAHKTTGIETREDFISIDLLKIYKQLVSKRKLIGIWCGIALIIGVVIAFSIPKKYVVNAELAPEMMSNSSKLSSITSILGVSNLTSGADAISPVLYPKIVHSTPFMTKLLTARVTLEEEGHSQVMSVQKYLTEHTRKPWWSTAISWTVDLLSKKESNIRNTIDPFQLTADEDNIIQSLNRLIDVSIDKKTMGISISAKAQNAHVAADMCNIVTTLLQQSITEYRTNKAKQDLAYFQTLFNEAQTEYHKAQSNYAHYVDSHQGIILLSVKAEQERLQNEKNLKFQLYNSIAGELQQAKAKVQQETPVFAIVTPATIPLKPTAPKKKIIAALFLFLGFLGGCADILFWHKEEEESISQEE